MVMFAPLPLLAGMAMWTGVGIGNGLPSDGAGVAPAGWVAARGAACLLVATATATSLRPWDLQEALARLPLPSILVALIVQIVRQAGTLVDEVLRMGAAVRVRGGVGGWKGTWRVAAALPMSWLPRVGDRAERVARAMEARDFDGLAAPTGEPGIVRRDVLWLSMTTGWVLLVVALRLVEGG
jgi:energy-coupling factor transporter transmembrane protein EcfT